MIFLEWWTDRTDIDRVVPALAILTLLTSYFFFPAPDTSFWRLDFSFNAIRGQRTLTAILVFASFENSFYILIGEVVSNWCAIFIFVEKGAQQLFVRASPRLPRAFRGDVWYIMARSCRSRSAISHVHAALCTHKSRAMQLIFALASCKFQESDDSDQLIAGWSTYYNSARKSRTTQYVSLRHPSKTDDLQN